MNVDTAQHVASGVGEQHPEGMEETEAPEPSNTYDVVFPALPVTEAPNKSQHQDLGQWNQKMKMKSTVVTQVFQVPVEERRFYELNSQRFGDQSEQAKICAEIMHETNAHIEMSSSKDQSLTFVVTGKEDAVLKARRKIISELQTQASVTISIPKEHHRFILGKNGKKLNDLVLRTATKITIPRPDENSDKICIMGTKEGIDQARHEIQLISDEQGKLAIERLAIPKIYHPFISGPYAGLMTQMQEETGARINIPPVSVMQDEITITGEKEAVARATEMVNKIYEEKKSKCQTVSVEVRKAQHKYVIGPRGQTIQEILQETDVSVEMPSNDSMSETITLRGEQVKLGKALTLLYEKANSVSLVDVDAPSWLHRLIIGKKGATIKQITQDLPKVHVEFSDGQDKIKVEGPHDEVATACKLLEEKVKEIISKFSFEEIQVDPKYHRHIIGKSGANVNRLKQELGVQVHIPSDQEDNHIIRIEGSPENVSKAKQNLLEMVKKMENEVTKELTMEQRFHRSMIGTKGENIKEIRDRFNQVNVTFPEPGVKSSKVIIRGSKQDVEHCFKHMEQLNKDLIAKNFKMEVPIFKQFHKFIIGKEGANIKKIKDETDTKIELPAEGSDSDVITITGKKENVLSARDKIIAIQNSLDNIVEVTIIIPAKFHNSIIGAKGRLIRSIKDECGGVAIHFPQEGAGSDKVTIRGPKDDVDKAKKQLVEMSNEKQLTDYSEEIKTKREHHKFLIGKSGANIKKVRDRTGARIIFPNEKDDDKESIIIIGHKDAVVQARKELDSMIKDLEKVVELEMHVDPKHHRHFVARRGEVLHQIQEEYGCIQVSFPRNTDMTNDVVTLKGPAESVEKAKQHILQVVADLDARVTIECVIAQKFHRMVMGTRGRRVQSVTAEFDVHIKFPDRETREEDYENGEKPTVNGDINGLDFDPDKPRKNDIIYITGRQENCEAAKNALLDFVPITIEVSIPFDLHRYIIGQKGKEVREMMERHDVNITVPPESSQSDVIRVTGPPAHVEQAKAALLERVEQLESEREDRELRSFKLTIPVDPKYHPKIIGRRGAIINRIRTDHKVSIQFPDRSDMNEKEITIIGYEANAQAARDDILKIVGELEGQVERAIDIDRRVHPRLIGARGRNIRRVMEDYKVDIRFPRNTDENPNQVLVLGMEDCVEEAIDHLKNLEEEYLQDVTEHQHPSSRFQDDSEDNRSRDDRGFVVKGGPWEQNYPPERAPDTSSTQEFPSFGSGDVPKPVAWGPRH